MLSTPQNITIVKIIGHYFVTVCYFYALLSNNVKE